MRVKILVHDILAPVSMGVSQLGNITTARPNQFPAGNGLIEAWVVVSNRNPSVPIRSWLEANRPKVNKYADAGKISVIRQLFSRLWAFPGGRC
jgi:hypothetical protein